MSDTQSSEHPQIFENSLEGVATVYRDEETADVFFTFGKDGGNNVRIGAHKILLAASSDVFRVMFYGDLKETGDIPVNDASDAAFIEFLQYFYKRQVNLTAKNIFEVMYLADKYNVRKCIEDCTEFMKRNLNDGNVCASLSCAILYNRSELLKRCKERIAIDTEAVLQSTGFLECDREALEYILKMDFFSCSEVKLFEACMAWVKAQSGHDVLSKAIVQEHLGDLLHEVRFASVTLKELCELQKKYNSVFTFEDFVTILNIIVNPELPSNTFSTLKREIKWNTNAIIECEREVIVDRDDPIMLLSDYSDYSTEFTTNVPLLLGSFTCLTIFGQGDNGDKPAEVVVQIIEKDLDGNQNEEKITFDMKTDLDSMESTALLPQPILVLPGFSYEIHLSKIPEDYEFDAFLMKRKINIDRDIIVNIRDDDQYDYKDIDGKGVHFDLSPDVDSQRYGLISKLSFNRI